MAASDTPGPGPGPQSPRLPASRLVQHPTGSYRYLPGIAPYSCGVVAAPGFEIVRVTFVTPRPWRIGFGQVEEYLRSQGRGRQSLCAMELRSPRPFSMAGFIAFNEPYCAVLQDWGLILEGVNPIARTNVCPPGLDATEPVLHAFSYTRPSVERDSLTFIVAGAGELREGTLVEQGIVRRGETDAGAMAEKAAYVAGVMEDRLHGLGAAWNQVSAVNVYTAHPLEPLLEPVLLPRVPAARRTGFTWHPVRPPVLEIEFEMDLHGVSVQRSL